MEHVEDVHLLSMASFLVDYPFANRLFPGSLDVLARFRAWGPTVILSDGDVVFQPRKVERSGIFEAVAGHVLIYIHKERALADVERRYPAAHYVLVDDKPGILAAVKRVWGDRVTTVLPRQGRYASDPTVGRTGSPRRPDCRAHRRSARTTTCPPSSGTTAPRAARAARLICEVTR